MAEIIRVRNSEPARPEPCEGGREAALEALDRGICGRGIELRNPQIRERTASQVRNAITRGAITRVPCGPAESKTLRTHRNFTRENREIPSLSVVETLRTGGRRR
jgi:hypothetical protein